MRLKIIGITIACMLFSTQALALNFQVDGDLRYLSEFQGNRTLSTTDNKINLGHMSLRALLRPKLFVTDQFTFVSEWSLLEPEYNDFPIANPQGHAQYMFGTIPIRGYSFGLLGGGNSPVVRPLVVNELYFRWDADVLRIQAGRQPRHWGLGMIYDDGADSPFYQFKSVMDALAVILPFGELEIQAGYVKNVEAFFDTDAEDHTTIFFQAYHKKESTKLETGFLAEYVIMGDQAGAAHVSAPPPRTDKSGRYFLLDGFGIVYPMPSLRLSAEIAYADGKSPVTPPASPVWHKMSTFAAIMDATLLLPSFKIGIGAGFYRGDKAGAANQRTHAFVFSHPNRFVGFMLNRGAFGLDTVGTRHSHYPYQSKPGLYDLGTGQFYFKPHAEILFGNNWTITLAIPFSWAHVQGPHFADREGTFMGIEPDVTISHVWGDMLTTTFFMGVLIPGNFWNTATRSAKMGYDFGLLGHIRF